MGHAAYVAAPRDPAVEYYHVIMMLAFLWLPQVLASFHIWIPGMAEIVKEMPTLYHLH